ncbi:hypothetical protein [Pseudomonas sp. RL_105y_Pfl2_101]|uniref:hypothetical protein n=1 Tax=Pseudomonas sp. RL_105y_Pfl2_101 TaxID=3088708 RepID=UPI0030DB1361
MLITPTVSHRLFQRGGQNLVSVVLIEIDFAFFRTVGRHDFPWCLRLCAGIGFSRVVSVNQLKGWFHLFASGSATFGTLPIGEGRNFLGNDPHGVNLPTEISGGGNGVLGREGILLGVELGIKTPCTLCTQAFVQDCAGRFA